MPRLRATPISSEEQANRYLRAAIARQKEMLDLKDQELADAIRRDRATFCCYKKNPDNLGLRELRVLAKMLHWTQEDVCNILCVKCSRA